MSLFLLFKVYPGATALIQSKETNDQERSI